MSKRTQALLAVAAIILVVRAAQADNRYLDDPHNRAEAASTARGKPCLQGLAPQTDSQNPHSDCRAAHS
jgi:hypothetical protein